MNNKQPVESPPIQIIVPPPITTVPLDPPTNQAFCTGTIAYSQNDPAHPIMSVDPRVECQISLDIALSVLLTIWLQNH